jgi:hypothetical protein
MIFCAGQALDRLADVDETSITWLQFLHSFEAKLEAAGKTLVVSTVKWQNPSLFAMFANPTTYSIQATLYGKVKFDEDFVKKVQYTIS